MARHRADDLARGLLALLARDRLEVRDQVGRVVRVVALVVAVDPDPVHLPAAGDFLLADHRDVVLGHAGHDAGAAADAGRQVDGHRPPAALLFVAGTMVSGISRLSSSAALPSCRRPSCGCDRVVRVAFSSCFGARPSMRGARNVLVDRLPLRRCDRRHLGEQGNVIGSFLYSPGSARTRRGWPGEPAAGLHAPVGLGAGRMYSPVDRLELAAECSPRGVRRAERVGVEPGPLPDLAGLVAAVAEVHRDRVVRVARLNPDRGRDLPAADGQFDHVDHGPAVLAAAGRFDRWCVQAP